MVGVGGPVVVSGGDRMPRFPGNLVEAVPQIPASGCRRWAARRTEIRDPSLPGCHQVQGGPGPLLRGRPLWLVLRVFILSFSKSLTSLHTHLRILVQSLLGMSFLL